MTVIIDTGCANLASVRFAFERLGASAQISADADTILSAERVILPGVGSAQAAMVQLEQRGLLPVLPRIEQPLLGICLGMQLLGERSDEGNTTLPGLLPFTTERLKVGDQPLPHMGWNTLEPVDHPLFAGIRKGDYVYFVHSYGVACSDLTLARCDYGQPFSASVGRGNIMGVQFHPERSGAVGARILKNFLEIPA
ncbi:imidazole glycerol phosphate synthase subunit HisH [Ferrimonas balearica]|uniref:imidazole glycerol phosphate synthase subunit HisH n=1 Tax=Ferrimonas balearica TaxID=44012 RepID=UPI001C57D2B8|nr:imidazole glycerol phosphate synthase subunit HisH [Ferrimonas balearica]MBW3163585.1 imidazole glycerol phosphate synthase subunit HisH [Ferrimonas balearica]MBY5979597.1 imidazole glycerol phosphate synthase subunit HisH [Ferrimonas balearica]MBY6105867.1 imidazole glycerol phosphate synthase subunit HisH [Ferrimonas balearica]MBY6223535.1 imidazole glycerol phosphate synthase subunit HisH [Ferrimonas balearica]